MSTTVKMKPAHAIGIVGAIAVIGVIAALKWSEWRARKWDSRWNEFVAEWEAKGERFDIAATLPPRVREEENFFRHPFLQRVAAADVDWIAIDDAIHIDGYDNWKTEASWQFETEGTPPAPMPEELATRILNATNPIATDLDAFAEAARRPAASLDVATGHQWMESFRTISHISNVSRLLNARADALLATGAVEPAVDDLVTMIHAARHLRATHSGIGMTISAGFDRAAATTIVEAAPWTGPLRSRLLAALEARASTLEEEFAAMLRAERNAILDVLDEEFDLTRPSQRALAAGTRIALCESLQAMVLSERGVRLDRVDGDHLGHYVRHWMEAEAPPKNSHSLGLSIALIYGGLFEGLELVENDRNKAIAILRIEEP
jgi:hypothetical protein